VTTPEALQHLEGDCRVIVHRSKRSKNTAFLHEKYSGQVSRRDLNAKVREARQFHNAEYRKNQKHLQWRGSGIVWAMDDTEYDYNGSKVFVHNVRDIGAQYVMEPMVSEKIASGLRIAENLEKLFQAHGAPLILKRDNGSNFCNAEVNSILAKWGVIPLTSPAYCPKYNGAIEWSQGQLKEEISNIIEELNGSWNDISLHAKLASHSINHRQSPVLLGRAPCHTIATSSVRFSLSERKQILYWIEAEQEVILKGMDPNPDRRAAWRQAVTRWLTSNGLLIIKEAS